MGLRDVDLGGFGETPGEKMAQKSRRIYMCASICSHSVYIYINIYIYMHICFWRSVCININCVVLRIVYCVLMHYSLFHNIRFIEKEIRLQQKTMKFQLLSIVSCFRGSSCHQDTQLEPHRVNSFQTTQHLMSMVATWSVGVVDAVDTSDCIVG